MERQIRQQAARLALGTMPAPVLERALNHAAAAVMRRHPGLAGRLAPWAGATVLITLTDLRRPLLLRIEAPPQPCRIDLAPAGAARPAAEIRGSLGNLLDLVEGRVDGDALFFSRHLTFAGDTEIVLALRNAIDGEAIDMVEDAFASLGPPGLALHRLLARAAAVAAAVERRAEGWRERLLAPAFARCDGLAAEIDALRAALADRRRTGRS